MNESRRNASNIGLRRQKPRTEILMQLNDPAVLSQSPNTSQTPVYQKQARRRTEIHKRQTHPTLAKSKHQTSVHPSAEDDDDSFHPTTAQTLMLSPKTHRRTMSDASNLHSHHRSSMIPVNPDFDLLPVMKTERARNVFDFYVNSYAKSILEVSPANVAPYTFVVHQILHDELLFTAFTTTSEAARWRIESLYGDAPLSIVKGYGKTIQLLHQRLKSGLSGMTSIIMLAMGQLTAIETLTKNVSASARHLAGMNTLMASGARAPLTPNSTGLQSAVDIWSEYFRFRETVHNTIPKFSPLTYPRHPFDPKLSMQVSSLPPGFNEIVLSGRVSIEVLSLMDRFNNYFRQLAEMTAQGIHESRDRTSLILQTAVYCIDFIQIRLLSTIERFIIVALMAYVVRRDRIHPALVNTRNYFQICCGYLNNGLTTSTEALHHEDQDILNFSANALHREDRESDLLKWLGVLLLLTSSPEAHARKLALRILPTTPELMPVLKTCQQFFWDDDLTNALLSGKTLITSTSNDIIAENVKQDVSVAQRGKKSELELDKDGD